MPPFPKELVEPTAGIPRGEAWGGRVHAARGCVCQALGMQTLPALHSGSAGCAPARRDAAGPTGQTAVWPEKRIDRRACRSRSEKGLTAESKLLTNTRLERGLESASSGRENQAIYPVSKGERHVSDAFTRVK